MLKLSNLQLLLLSLKPIVWPIFISLLSSFFLIYFVSYFKKQKHRHSSKTKKSSRPDDLIVSVFANGTILRDSDFSVIQENLKLFLTICSKTRTYVIVKIPDESHMEKVLSSFESCGAFKSGLLKHRVMFCQFSNGRISMVQQLQPHLHVEPDTENLEFVNTKLMRQNVTTFDNMESILNNQNNKSDQNK